MTYPYKYTYKTNKDAVGYSGPMPIETSVDVFRNGIVDNHTSQALIRSAIQRILQTNPGERVMQPEFGVRLRSMLFEPLDANWLLEMREVLGARLESQEPRIKLNSIDFQPDPDQHTVVISLSYTYKNTGETDRLDFLLT